MGFKFEGGHMFFDFFFFLVVVAVVFVVFIYMLRCAHLELVCWLSFSFHLLLLEVFIMFGLGKFMIKLGCQFLLFV